MFRLINQSVPTQITVVMSLIKRYGCNNCVINRSIWSSFMNPFRQIGLRCNGGGTILIGSSWCTMAPVGRFGVFGASDKLCSVG